jgi:hypothetical protein
MIDLQQLESHLPPIGYRWAVYIAQPEVQTFQQLRAPVKVCEGLLKTKLEATGSQGKRLSAYDP